MSRLWLLLAIALLSLTAIAVISYLYADAQQYPVRLGPTDPAMKPARIVSLAPNLTEILFELGLAEQVVAVSNDSDYPAEATRKKKIGTFWQPDTEAIIAAAPDLVLALHFEQQRAVADTLNRLGYRVLTLKIETIEDLFAAIEEIGAAAGCEARAHQLISSTRSQMESLKSRFSSTNNVKVLWAVQAEPLRVAGAGTFISEVLELAGGQNAMKPTIQQYPQIGAEELLACDPQVIVQSAMGTKDLDAQQQAARLFWRKWPGLPAVKNGRIYVIDPDTTLRLGPRLPQGIQALGRCLHPNKQSTE
ncbi:MAG TPA: helical backbone metal receptor [Sedimentisphaerales bacterium]|nr:helical backbone metal receptor [Sedimentisphaerales bacterium]